MDEKNLRSILKSLGIKVTHKGGNWLDFSCPFAQWTHRKGTDHNPSCGAVIDRGKTSYYKCHTCKMGGRISSLVRALEKYKNTSFKGLALRADLAEAECDIEGFEDEYIEEDLLGDPLNETAYGGMFEPAWEVPVARDYLKHRGISRDTTEFLELGYDFDDYRITFPIRGEQGGLYGYSGRSIIENKEDYPYYKYPKIRDYYGLPKRHMLLGAEHFEEGYPILVVEGLFAYATMYELGVDDFCTPMAMLGSELTIFKARLLKELNETVVLLPDPDDAGDACLWGGWDKNKEDHKGGGAVDKLITAIPLIIPVYPDDCTDVDDLTYEEVRAMVEDTELYTGEEYETENELLGLTKLRGSSTGLFGGV